MSGSTNELTVQRDAGVVHSMRARAVKRKWVLGIAAGVAGLGALLPIAVLADDPTATQAAGVAADTVWVITAACLVMFMQAGFAMLEVGFSRMKNVGTVVAKVVTNLSVSSISYWAVGFGFAFGAGGLFAFIGGSGFFPTFSPGSALNLPALAFSTVPASAKWFFEFVFCAVSLAIVWGTMIERTKFIVYILFGVPFAAFIYPLISHQLFGGGFLMATLGSQDFAGSTVVHLTGATAGLAGLLLLGPRIGKYEKGRPNAIPGHNMPLAQLGVLILWFGWFGFNPGSTLNATNLHFADVVVVTNLAAAAGAVAALATIYLITKTMDVGMIGNGAIAALVAITAPSGYVEPWAALVIGAVAGVIVVVGVLALDKYLDDPVGRAAGPRPGRHLGHAQLRAVHGAGAGQVQRRRPGRPFLHRQLSPARRAGDRGHGLVRDGVRPQLRPVLDHQEDSRPARLAARGDGRARHQRARHVGLPRIVHAGAGRHLPSR